MATARRGWFAIRRGATKAAACLPDLGSHLLDTCRFWFGDIGERCPIVSAQADSKIARPTMSSLPRDDQRPRIELEMTLCMWRNHFTCDILAESGTAHIRSSVQVGPDDVHASAPRAAERPSA